MPKYTNKGSYLFVEVTEPYSFKTLKDLIHQTSKHCEKDKLNKVLADLTNMDGDFKILERYEIGLEIAKVWGQSIQVATVAKESQVNFLAENVAVNRGANLRVFTKMQAALEWLNTETN